MRCAASPRKRLDLLFPTRQTGVKGDSSMLLNRRHVLAAGAVLATPAFAQHAGHQPQFERLNTPGRVEAPPEAQTQRVFESPAPRASNPGRWIERAALPVPRSEMVWAGELAGRVHYVGGYGEQRVDRAYHQIYDPTGDRWTNAADLPRGSNHVGVATLDGRLYAIGGFIEQNRTPHGECFVYISSDHRWQTIRPLPRPTGATVCVPLNGKIHVIGGAIGNSLETRTSIATHLVYDPQSDMWSEAAPMPTARDHAGAVVHEGRIHLIGGRVDTFHTNSQLHHSYEPTEDRWRMRNPMPTARSGHGAVIYKGKIFCMGGEGWQKVFGQNEAYDLSSDQWQSYAPMITPRHGTGAALVGGRIHIAGGGPVMGGGYQSAVHEAFELD